MKNRVMHLLKDWDALVRFAAPSTPTPEPPSYPLPRTVNMLMPAEMWISRELLLGLIGASIMEIDRRRRAAAGSGAPREMAEIEAALQQQLSFRDWAINHPGSFIPVAIYPAGFPGNTEAADPDLEAGWGPQ